MRQSNFPKAAWSSSKHVTRKFYQSNIFRTLAFFSLLAVALMSFSAIRSSIFTAQAQQSTTTNNEAASSFEASEAAVQRSTKSEAKLPDVDDSPKNIEPTNLGGAGCGWTSGTVYPINILDNAVTAVGNNLYSFTGVGGNAIIANSFRFDGTTWTAIAPTPVALEFPAAVSDGTSAYIINGVNAGTRNTLYRYNPATNDYTTLAPSAAATSTWSHGAVFLNGKIYKIAGLNVVGTTTTPVNAVEIYDIASNTWSTGANYPLALGFVGAFTQGGFIYGVGGTGTGAGAQSAKTFRYDPVANTWDDAAIADLPVARFGSAVGFYSDGAVVAGGFVNGVISTNVVQWNPTTNVWDALPDLLQARARMNGAVVGGAFWVIGGTPTAGGFVGSNDNQRLFCPPSNAPFVTGNITYVSENATPANNTPDPGETVTVSLNLQNLGGVATGNVTATLQATGGITPVTTTQTYGVLAPGGAATSRNFTFTVPTSAVCGSQVTLTFTVTDGTTTTTITRTYTLGILGPPGATTNFSNTAAITINDNAPATPYPATIAVSGLTGTAYNVSLTLNGFSHTFPSDVDVLLVGPGGQKMVVLSDVGGGTDAVNANVTLSDSAATPIGAAIVTGTFKPTNIAPAQDIFPAPAPVGPYESPAPAGTATLNSVFGTGTFNGDWSLYVVDDVGTDAGSISGGWTITFQVAPVQVCSTVGGGVVESRADFNADGKTDVSVFRNGTWFVQQSGGPFVSVQFGAAGDQIVPGDYDADNKTDYAVFRPGSPANFYVLNSANSTVSFVSWGGTGDIPLTGDFTGDGRSDFTVYRPSNNTWYTYSLAGGTVAVASIGTAGQTPVTLDYDGDGTTDRALWNSSNGVWTLRRSSDASVVAVQFGATGDKLVPADYDGDNKEDLAVYRGGQWIALLSGTNAAVFINFGAPTDVPVPGDYDGDGKDDQAVYRDGVWYINASTSGFSGVSFGAPTDKPVPAGYLPQ